METFCIPDHLKDCAICYEQASGSDTHVMSYDKGPLAIGGCLIKVRGLQRGFLVHGVCWDLLREMAPSNVSTAVLRRGLLQLTTSLSFLWPVSEAVRSARAKQIALWCGEIQLHSIAWEGSLFGEVLARLLKLPAELRIRVLEFSRPCQLLWRWTVQTVSDILPFFADNVPSPQELDARKGLRFARHKILGRTYAGAIEAISTPNPAARLILSFDDTACTSIASEREHQLRPGMWHRIIPREESRNLRIHFKGCLVRDVLSGHIADSYLWDGSDPPRLLTKHSYGLPAADMTLDEALQNPVRLRRIEVPKNASGVSAACVGGSTLALHVHVSHLPRVEMYDRVEGLARPGTITWIYYCLNAGEVITEVDVRGFPNAGSSDLWFPCLVLFTSHGRRLPFGSYIVPELRSCYTFHSLVNSEEHEVSTICVNERHWSTSPLRVGVTCRPSSSPWNVTKTHWEEELPKSSPPTSAQVDPWYHSTANVDLYSSFQICTGKKSTRNQCLGLLLHRHDGSKVLGQWRWDEAVSDIIKLPTSLVLAKAWDGERPYVFVASDRAEHDIPHTPIVGTLEWWTGPEGSQVSQIETEDPFRLF